MQLIIVNWFLAVKLNLFAIIDDSYFLLRGFIFKLFEKKTSELRSRLIHRYIDMKDTTFHKNDSLSHDNAFGKEVAD